MEVYVVDIPNKEIVQTQISEDDPLSQEIRTFLVRVKRKVLFWTREKVFSIRLLFTEIPAAGLEEQKIFTERLARQLATTAAATAGSQWSMVIGFVLGFGIAFISGKWL